MPAPGRRATSALPAAVALFLALLLRLPGLDSWPPALHQDEASNGVDGWSLLSTGAERSGRVWPVFLEGFGAGDNRTSLGAILTIPGTALFGPGSSTTRLPAALVGAGTVLATFLFLRRIRGTGTGAIGAVLLALNPWHIYLSRFGHEASLTPAFLVTALWLVSPRSDGRAASLARWTAAGIVLGVGLYTYASCRLFLPCLLLPLLLAAGGSRRSRLLLIFSFVLIVLPLLRASLAHPERFFARAQFVSVFGNLQPPGVALLLVVRQYAAHFLPGFLFVHGDGNPLHSPPGGVLLWAELTPFVIGLGVAVQRRDRWDRLFLLWLLLYPIASATTLGDRPGYIPHSLRAAVGLPVFQILAAQGVAAGLRFVARRNLGMARAGWVLLGGGFAGNFLLFAIAFTGAYSRAAAPLYHAAHPPAIRYLAANRERFTAALISCAGNPQAYVYSILYGLQTPEEYRRAEKEIDETETFHLVRRAGDLFYVHEPADQRRHLPHLHGKVWALVVPGQLRSGRPIASFPCPDGSPGLEVRELAFPPAEAESR